MKLFNLLFLIVFTFVGQDLWAGCDDGQENIIDKMPEVPTDLTDCGLCTTTGTAGMADTTDIPGWYSAGAGGSTFCDNAIADRNGNDYSDWVESDYLTTGTCSGADPDNTTNCNTIQTRMTDINTHCVDNCASSVKESDLSKWFNG